MKRVICAVGLLVLVTGCGGKEIKLDGAGSTLVQPLMEKWADEFAKSKQGTIYYESIGSGIGIQRFAAHISDFACTEAPLSDQETTEAKQGGGDVLYLPLVFGAVVPAYHLDGLTAPLTFSGGVLADIYLGKITRWNDPALKELNPGVTLPDREIAVVHRSEPSGSTFLWSEYLAKVSPTWKEKVGIGTALNWPTGSGRLGNRGVAQEIKDTPGTIGYVSLGYASSKGLAHGQVKNRAGEAVAGSIASIRAAAAGAEIPEDLRLSLVDAPGKGAFPISGVVWAVVQTRQSTEKRRALVEFLRWAAHDGQEFAEGLNYAPLSAEVVKRIDARLDQLAAGN
jgi:phosphate transport system substrate-binding protein